ncbi:hypothetical protein F5Y14DRAFT_439922 [Nemania sp. NC0429]|nr:hypothetical protein F5Y14DRAFT_439922 [Nemania sp. NC0429]
MDPVTALGAAGSVVGIASFGLQLSQILIKYISQVWSAQQSLEDIVEEIQSTTYALEGIYSYLAEEVDNIRRGYPLCLFSTTSLMKVKVTADRCLVVFWRIEATISGNWPAELEDHLVKKLTEFNNKLVSSSPDSMIASIGSQLTENPLGLRDKLQWPSKASKLAKYCGQLQRYQDNLQLLLQIVVLGQQRLKPNSAEEVIRMMLKSYAIISQVATPKELHIIAEEARAQSRTRRRNEGRDHSVARSHTKRPQTPVQSAPGNIPLDRLPINPDTRQHSVPQPESPSGPQSIVASAAKARSPRPVTPTQINRAIAHEHDYMLSSGLSLAAAQKQPMQSTNLGNGR